MESTVSNRKKIYNFIGLFLLIGILIISVSLFVFRGNKPSGYQAVFLTNGQVYFGLVSNKNDEFVRLNKIFYLQTKQPLQNQVQETLNQTDLTLVKLGNELHGPEDLMEINRDHILFIEDLKPDSKVTQAIYKYFAK